MQDTQHANRAITPRKKSVKTPKRAISSTPKDDEPDTWTIRPDDVARALVRRARNARPGVSRTFIILELVKNGLKEFASKKDAA